MKTAISVELGGVSYQLDPDAFLALHAYLDRAAERLGEHPDRAEVLAGLERSIGERLARGGERSAPIGQAELAIALKGVGKVDGPRLGPKPDGSGREPEPYDSGREPEPNGPRPRRLYRLDDGKKIAGVCAGLAAYADLDVGLVRAIAVLAAFFTGGFLVVALYVASIFLVPPARTSTELAAARGALRSA